MGGSDDPSNIVELSIKEHAEAHKKLYKQYGKTEDKIAWLSLSGILKKEETYQEKVKLGRENANKILEKKYGPNWRSIISQKGADRIKEIIKENPDYLKGRTDMKGDKNPMFGKSHNSNTRKILSKLQTGKRNSQYGTMWIYSLEEKKSKKIKKDEVIPAGWLAGRMINF